MDRTASASAPRICIHFADARDARAIACFERRLPAAARRATGHAEPAPAESSVAVVARDRDSGIVVGHAVALPAADGEAKVAVRVAEAYAAHDIGTRLVAELTRVRQ
jgi:hypothetical protein